MSDNESDRGIKFTLDKLRSKQFRSFIAAKYNKEDLEALWGGFKPKFDVKKFDLKRPKMDHQIKRRIKRIRTYDAARDQAREKNFSNI